MYKVFVNDCPIILTDNKKISTNLKISNFNNTNIVELINELFQNKIAGTYLICNNLEFCWQAFKKNFKIEEAAGGKVFNSKNEVLFIYRFEKWDLPKGKLEKGETIEQCAIREVEEECGISNLEIDKQLETTYHIFKRNDKIILKITYWFLMSSTFMGELIPQTNEGISAAVFKNNEQTKQALTNTYENIKLLF